MVSYVNFDEHIFAFKANFESRANFAAVLPEIDGKSVFETFLHPTTPQQFEGPFWVARTGEAEANKAE